MKMVQAGRFEHNGRLYEMTGGWSDFSERSSRTILVPGGVSVCDKGWPGNWPIVRDITPEPTCSVEALLAASGALRTLLEQRQLAQLFDQQRIAGFVAAKAQSLFAADIKVPAGGWNDYAIALGCDPEYLGQQVRARVEELRRQREAGK